MRRAHGRAARTAGALALAGAALFMTAAGPSPSEGNGENGPTEAGTSFRTATALDQGQRGTAEASAGDYLYWVVPVDTGQRATIDAKVTLPEAATGSSTWQIDVYDGLRRRQACMYGAQTRTAAAGDASVGLSCTLRTVRGWAEPWSGDPLPGSYYIRLTVLGLPAQDLGLPVAAEVSTTLKDIGGSAAVDGSLAAPLTAEAATGDTAAAGSDDSGDSEDSEDSAEDGGDEQAAAVGEPEDGWSSGWWSDRWVWTGIGGILAALAGVGGYTLTRGSGRPSHVPPGV
nr:hypothetical protein [Streptomyces sp. GC420]